MRLLLSKSCGPNRYKKIIFVASQTSRNEGVDAVIITASSQSNDLYRKQWKTKRGRIVLVVVGLELRRSDFYEKEPTFQVARMDPVDMIKIMKLVVTIIRLGSLDGQNKEILKQFSI